MYPKSEADIVCLNTTLRILRLHFLFPQKGKESVPGRWFYIKFYVIYMMSSGLLVGSILHLCVSIKEGNFLNIDLDLTTIFSITGAYWMDCFFFKNIKGVVELLRSICDYSEFGKPPKFEKRNYKLILYSKLYWLYLLITVLFYIFASLHSTGTCENDNIVYNITEVCGLLTYTWFPFDFSYSPAKQILSIYQAFDAYLVFITSGQIAFAILEITEHIVIRIHHLKCLFINASASTNYVTRRRLFNEAIKYHNFIIHIGKLANECFSGVMFLHILLTGGILGTSAFRLVNAHSISAISLFVGWFVGLSLVCSAGQRILDESMSVGVAVYTETEWYNLEEDIKRDILFILMRANKPIILRGGSFGLMSHSLIVTVLKGAYSYIALLSQKNR